MPRLTVTITDEESELPEEIPGDNDKYKFKSKVEKVFIQEYEQLESEIEELQSRRNQLQQQLAATNKRQNGVTVVEYVEKLQKVDRYQRKIDQANIFTRAKWITGVPLSEGE